MRVYGLLLKRDIHRNPWNFLMLIVILFLSFAVNSVEITWGALFILFAGAPLLQLSEHNGSAFRMLLPKAKQYEFNYALSCSSVFCALFCVAITHTLSQALWYFSLISVLMSIVSLLGADSNKSVQTNIILATLLVTVVIYAGFLDQWLLVFNQFFTIEKISQYQTLLTSLFLSITACSIWFLRRSFILKNELAPVKLTCDLSLINLRIGLGGDSKNKSLINQVWNRYLTFSNHLFGLLVSEKRLHQGLYPKSYLLNQLNAVFLLVTSVGFSISLSLTSSPQEYWYITEYMGILLFLSLTIINLAHSFDFISNKKIMAYLWLKDASKSRKKYMSKLAKLMLVRQVSSLFIFSALTLGLSFWLLGTVSQSLLIVVLAGCMTTTVQVAFTLNIAISQNYTAGLIYGTLAFTLMSFSFSWSVLTSSKELGLVFMCFGLISLAFIWKSWINAYLELK
jgi:hypothetical protein